MKTKAIVAILLVAVLMAGFLFNAQAQEEEKVFIAKDKDPAKYHGDKECADIKGGDIQEVTKAEAEAEGMTACKCAMKTE